MLHKRKKANRMRGSKNHGWGVGSSHHKNSGNKGGVGNAGSGKRADQKRPSYWKEPTGRQGFKIPTSVKKVTAAITLQRAQELITNGTLKEEKGMYDLTAAGYTKLLAKGSVSGPLKLKITKASQGAIDAVKEAGGDVQTDALEQ